MKTLRIILVFLMMLCILCSCGSNENNNKSNDIDYGSTLKVESTTSAFSINGQKVTTETYEFNIPDGFTILETNQSLKLENSSESLTVTIEEHECSRDDFEQYVSDTINSYSAIGANVSKPNYVTIEKFEMLRTELEYLPIQAYIYFTDIGDKAVLISVISEKEKLSSDKTDELVKQICHN